MLELLFQTQPGQETSMPSRFPKASPGSDPSHFSPGSSTSSYAGLGGCPQEWLSMPVVSTHPLHRAWEWVPRAALAFRNNRSFYRPLQRWLCVQDQEQSHSSLLDCIITFYNSIILLERYLNGSRSAVVLRAQAWGKKGGECFRAKYCLLGIFCSSG